MVSQLKLSWLRMYSSWTDLGQKPHRNTSLEDYICSVDLFYNQQKLFNIVLSTSTTYVSTVFSSWNLSNPSKKSCSHLALGEVNRNAFPFMFSSKWDLCDFTTSTQLRDSLFLCFVACEEEPCYSLSAMEVEQRIPIVAVNRVTLSQTRSGQPNKKGDQSGGPQDRSVFKINEKGQKNGFSGSKRSSGFRVRHPILLPEVSCVL